MEGLACGSAQPFLRSAPQSFNEFVQDDAPNHKGMARHTNWIYQVRVPLSRGADGDDKISGLVGIKVVEVALAYAGD